MVFLTNVTFCVVYILEAVLTLSGNIFTIFVFWKHRAELKRASYLLVNLAFADLLVAISIVFTLIQQVKIALQDTDVNQLQSLLRILHFCLLEATFDYCLDNKFKRS